MLLRAERDLDIDLSRSHVIGDTYSDVEMAWNAGAEATLVLTGYGRGAYEHHRKGWARQPSRVSPNLFAAVTDIVWEDRK
jgi:D-glycero-D-manno-heptose 1,7-bisphosphate phosphatase